MGWWRLLTTRMACGLWLPTPALAPRAPRPPMQGHHAPSTVTPCAAQVRSLLVVSKIIHLLLAMLAPQVGLVLGWYG